MTMLLSRFPDQKVTTREAFYEAVRDKTEESVIEFVKSHHLTFMQPEEAIKIRKMEKRHPLKERGIDRSTSLARSLLIFADGTIVPTGRNRISRKSTPGGRSAQFLGSGSDKSVYKVKDLSSGDDIAIGVGHRSVEDLRNECRMSQIVDSPYIHASRFFFRESTQSHKKRNRIKAYAVSKICKGSLDRMIRLDPKYLLKHPEHLTQIEKAVEACYNAGMLHNDLHGNNIFITEEEIAILSDFGQAVLIENLSGSEKRQLENKQITNLTDLRRRYTGTRMNCAMSIELQKGSSAYTLLSTATLILIVLMITSNLFTR